MKKIIYLFCILVTLASSSANQQKTIKIKEIIKNENNYFITQEIDGAIPLRDSVKLLNQNELKIFLSKKYITLPTKNLEVKSRIKNIKVKIEASSSLKEGKVIYKAKNIFDSDVKTVWSEGKNDYGFKEWLKFTLQSKEKMYVTSIIILPGNNKSKILFKKNNRPQTLILKSHNAHFEDDIEGEKQSSSFLCFDRLLFYDNAFYHVFNVEERFMHGKKIDYTLYIENVYKGSKYNDTCISEVIFVLARS